MGGLQLLKLYKFTRWGTLLVAQLVEALRYKHEGRRFHSRWYHYNNIIIPVALWPWDRLSL
jgi:hypothetical protein